MKKNFEVEPVSVPVPIAAQLLGVSPRTAWTLVKDQKLPSFRIGTRVLIPYSALTAFVNERITYVKKEVSNG